MAERRKQVAAAGRTRTAAKASRTSEAPRAKRSVAGDLVLGDKSVSAQARLDIRLSFLMHDVSRLRRSVFDQFMKPLSITRAQWWVLAHLSRQDGMMQTQLADVLEVGKASLGDVIESLEIGGWVTRRTGPADKRAKRVYLTRPAHTLIKRMTTLEIEFNEKAYSFLTHAERAALTESLLKIKQALGTMTGSIASHP